MKEWCLKHPWMTFFLIDWVACDIANAIAGRRSRNSIDRAEAIGEVAIESIREIKDVVKKSEDRTIGFKVS